MQHAVNYNKLVCVQTVTQEVSSVFRILNVLTRPAPSFEGPTPPSAASEVTGSCLTAGTLVLTSHLCAISCAIAADRGASGATSTRCLLCQTARLTSVFPLTNSEQASCFWTKVTTQAPPPWSPCGGWSSFYLKHLFVFFSCQCS